MLTYYARFFRRRRAQLRSSGFLFTARRLPGSMRGLHSTLAMDAGVTGHVVAASLGHESVNTAIQSYAKVEAVTNAAQQRTLTVLSGGLHEGNPRPVQVA